MRISLLILSACLLLALGVGGDFREYYSSRSIGVSIAANNSSYLSFECPETAVYMSKGEVGKVVKVENNLAEDVEIYLSAEGNIFNFRNPIILPSGESRLIEAEFNGNAGDYFVPLQINAYWANGSAKIPACSLHVVNSVEIRKVLLSGNESVSLFTREVWKLRILIKGNGNYTVLDTIPAEFEVLSVTASEGCFDTFHPGNSDATKITWTVHADGEEFLEVEIATKLNRAGKQEFTSPGIYYLNSGAEIKGLGLVSNSIIVYAR